MDAPTPIPPRAAIAHWCALSGMSRFATYRALRAGHLHAVKVGRSPLIDVPGGLRWLDSLPAVQAATEARATEARA